MAKKSKVNKTQAVRDYLKVHARAMSSEIAAALTKKGIKIMPRHVANIKSKINRTRSAKFDCVMHLIGFKSFGRQSFREMEFMERR